MGIRILDFDLHDGGSGAVPWRGDEPICVIAWLDGVPAGMARFEPTAGSRRRGSRTIAAALATFTEFAAGPPAAPAVPLPPVSVVICTRDRAELLRHALDALREQTVRHFELVIVDNAPRDARTRRVVEREWPGAVYVVEPVPGLPGARNAGIRAASGDVLAFTDDDCRPTPIWLEAIARRFGDDASLGAVTGPILPCELDTPAQVAMELRGGFNRGFRRVRYTLETADGPVYPVQAWKFGAGGNIALSRACLRELRGFDPALTRSEDLDILYRTVRAGYALAFEPAATVRHRHLRDWHQLRRRLFHWGRGYLTYLDKIVRTDEPEFARRASAERRHWLGYQLRRSAAIGRGDGTGLPAPLVVAELLGGVIGFRGYARARRHVRRPGGHGPQSPPRLPGPRRGEP